MESSRTRKFVISRVFSSLLMLISTASVAMTETGESAIARLRELKTTNQNTLQEARLRQEFMDRLIFQIDTRYKKGPMHEFLAETFKQMADRQPDSPHYDFLLQCSELMKLRKEKFESAIELTYRFMQAGGILHPITAEQFLAAQSYTNGETSESVRGMSREDLGDFVDTIELPKVAPASNDPFVPVLKNVEIRE